MNVIELTEAELKVAVREYVGKYLDVPNEIAWGRMSLTVNGERAMLSVVKFK